MARKEEGTKKETAEKTKKYVCGSIKFYGTGRTAVNEILQMFDCKPNGIHLLFQDVKLFRRSPPSPALRDLDVQDVEHDGNAEQRG